MTVLLQIAAGLGILTLGRQLFWLFVGGVGFVYGLNLATQIVDDPSNRTTLIIALLLGLVGALFALFLQRVAVGIAGFLGGSIITVTLLEILELDVGSALVPFLIGGIVGTILVAVLFDWALILLSSFTGSTIIVQSLNFGQAVEIPLLVILLISGIVVQASQMRRETANRT